MPYSYQSIPIDSIVLTDAWNLHPWECRILPEALEKSFAKVGILHPPIVLSSLKDSTFSIVHGYRRIHWATNTAKLENITCITIPNDINLAIILDIILADHLTGPTISLAEKARFLKIASRFLDEDTISRKFLLPLQLKKHTQPTLFCEILDQNEIIIKEIHEGRLQEKVITELLKIQDEEERLAVVQLFRYLRLGDGKQKRLFTLIRDIAFRENLSITDFLNKSEIQYILTHEEMNPPQKAQHLATLLQSQLTPEYNLYLDQFEKEKRSLQLPSNYSIDHVPGFEKDEVTLSITFKSFTECKTNLSSIIKGWKIPS